jgi:hypothetical protein
MVTATTETITLSDGTLVVIELCPGLRRTARQRQSTFPPG